MLAMLNNLLQLRRAQAGEALALSPTYKQVGIGTNIILPSHTLYISTTYIALIGRNRFSSNFTTCKGANSATNSSETFFSLELFKAVE